MKEHMKRMLRRLLRRDRESVPCNNNDDVQTIELLSSSDLDITGVRDGSDMICRYSWRE